MTGRLAEKVQHAARTRPVVGASDQEVDEWASRTSSELAELPTREVLMLLTLAVAVENIAVPGECAR